MQQVVCLRRRVLRLVHTNKNKTHRMTFLLRRAQQLRSMNFMYLPKQQDADNCSLRNRSHMQRDADIYTHTSTTTSILLLINRVYELIWIHINAHTHAHTSTCIQTDVHPTILFSRIIAAPLTNAASFSCAIGCSMLMRLYFAFICTRSE